MTREELKAVVERVLVDCRALERFRGEIGLVLPPKIIALVVQYGVAVHLDATVRAKEGDEMAAFHPSYRGWVQHRASTFTISQKQASMMYADSLKAFIRYRFEDALDAFRALSSKGVACGA